MEWTVIVEPVGRSGPDNMAVDEALMEAARNGGAFLRLYRWDPPCLSFGRHEPARTRYDVAAIRRLGLATVRRPTGGRAVWHEHEVTYAVAASVAMFGSLGRTYITLHRVLATALRRLGAPVELARRASTRPLGPGAGGCFAAPAGGELVVDGAKLVGSAQLRDGRVFLQHGSILLENDQDVVGRVTVGRRPATGATSLAAVLGRRVRFDDVAGAVEDAARGAWPGTWHHGTPPPVPPGGRYGDPAWTWRR